MAFDLFAKENDLLKVAEDVFAHGQFYVSLSRV